MSCCVARWPGCMSSSLSFDSVLATTVPSGASTLLRKNEFTVGRMRLPHILRPGLPFLLREEIRVNDVVGLDDGLFGS